MTERTQTIHALKIFLADTYTLYLKTQNYHWNVKGPQFYELHLLFEQQYEELAQAADEIAERIRACGERAPGSFAEFAQLKTISEAQNNLTTHDIVKDLKASHEMIVKSLSELSQKAEAETDEATQDLAIQRIAAHEKAIWMLGALLS